MDSPAASRWSRARGLLQAAILIILFGVLVGAVAADWTNARRVLRAADWRLLAPALIVTALSFFCSSTAYSLACRAFGVAARSSRLVLTGFVTMAVNNLITLGGAGYAVGAVLLHDRDTSLRDLAAASAFNAYLYFAVGTTCLPLSLLYVIVGRRVPPRAEVGLVLVVTLGCLLAVLVNLAVFHSRFRKVLLRFLGNFIPRFIGPSIPRSLSSFDDSFTHGLGLLRCRRGHLLGLLAAIIGDWLFCAATIWFCFAVRVHIMQGASFANTFGRR